VNLRRAVEAGGASGNGGQLAMTPSPTIEADQADQADRLGEPAEAEIAGDDSQARGPSGTAAPRDAPLARATTARPSWPFTLAATGVYVILAVLAYWPVPPLSTTRTIVCGCYDPAEQIWFLAWTPHAILHALNPFFTGAINQPYGANLAANTTMPLLGLITAPVTLTLGAVASYNLLLRLALCLSALSMFLLLRHYRLRRVVAFAGGLVFGFSPYLLAQGSLHLNLAFVPLLPPLVRAVDDLVVRPAGSARRAGLVLGGLATAQYFVSSELLVDFALVAVVVLAVLALRFPRRAVGRLRRLCAGLAWAILPVAVIAGYPLVFSLVGPEHVAGSPFDPGYVDGYRNDLLSPLVPTTRQLIAPSGWAALGNALVPNGAPAALGGGGPGAENGAYLGIPLGAATTLTVVWAALRRRGLVLVASLGAAVAFLFSLGTHLAVHGRNSGLSLPFHFLTEVPGLDFDVPARFSMITDLGVVVAVAAGLDALVGFTARRATTLRQRRSAALGIVVLSGLVVAPLLPAAAESSAGVGLPSYFSSPSVRSIAPGAVVLAYPYPANPDDQAMLWQVASGFRFALIGGYVLTPFTPGNVDAGGFDPPVLPPRTIQAVFEQAAAGAPSDPIPVAPWSKDRLRAFLRAYHVDDVVVGEIGAHPGWITSFLAGALHERPTREGGVTVFSDVQHSRLVRPRRRAQVVHGARAARTGAMPFGSG
jgi:hypothetical protein